MLKSIFTYLYFLPFIGFAQNLSFLKISIEKIGTHVQIDWTVAAGNQCQDLEIQHSLDGVNFETVYTYAGICGDPNVTLSYAYAHSEPILNHANYYRIKVNQDITETFRTFISGKDQLNLLTDFNKGLTQIDFQDRGGPVAVSVLDFNGRVIYNSNYENALEPIYLPSLNISPFIIQLEQNGAFLRKKHK